MKKSITAIALLTLTGCASFGRGDVINNMSREIGQSRPENCPSRWCACYLDNHLKRAGQKPRNSWRAIDFASYGQATFAHRGAIMVQRNHVGIVTGTCADGSIEAISGNQNNRVGIGCYPREKIIAFRR